MTLHLLPLCMILILLFAWAGFSLGVFGAFLFFPFFFREEGKWEGGNMSPTPQANRYTLHTSYALCSEDMNEVVGCAVFRPRTRNRDKRVGRKKVGFWIWCMYCINCSLPKQSLSFSFIDVSLGIYSRCEYHAVHVCLYNTTFQRKAVVISLVSSIIGLSVKGGGERAGDDDSDESQFFFEFLLA